MAEVLRGKRRGEHVELHQWANDWFTTEDGAVFSPASLRLGTLEMLDVYEHPCGMDRYYVFNLFQGTFRKRRR